MNTVMWDMTTAHRYVLYSFATYCPTSSLNAWNCTYCKPDSAGMQVQFSSYDGATDTLVVLGINPVQKESTIFLFVVFLFPIQYSLVLILSLSYL